MNKQHEITIRTQHKKLNQVIGDLVEIQKAHKIQGISEIISDMESICMVLRGLAPD